MYANSHRGHKYLLDAAAWCIANHERPRRRVRSEGVSIDPRLVQALICTLLDFNPFWLPGDFGVV